MKTPDNVRKLNTDLRATSLPKPPRNLSKGAKGWWNKLVKEYTIDDDYGLLLLETALHAFDRMNEASAVLDQDELSVTDRYGQIKSHPAFSIEKDSRSQMLIALKQLNLDIEPLGKAGLPAKS